MGAILRRMNNFEISSTVEHFGLDQLLEIRRGQFGKIYKCEDSKMNVFVLKVINRENFIKYDFETGISLSQKSPFIISVYEKKEIGENVFVVMEFANNMVKLFFSFFVEKIFLVIGRSNR
jgi:serine/threonine protein kinase